jgi:hypothetical protein
VTTDANGGDQGGAPGSAPAPGADTTLTPGQPAASWYSSIDFGDAKESATAALSSFKTPQELVGALDWRKSVSGGDEKAVKTFERFATLGDLGKAYREAQAKISSGELAKPLPKDATPEQIKAYREGNGIPEKPEGYFEKLPNGLVIGEDDKPLFEGFAKSMHELNAPPAMIHKPSSRSCRKSGAAISSRMRTSTRTSSPGRRRKCRPRSPLQGTRRAISCSTSPRWSRGLPTRHARSIRRGISFPVPAIRQSARFRPRSLPSRV